MNDMQEALLKSGLVTKEKVDEANKAQVEEEKRKKNAQKKERREKQTEERKERVKQEEQEGKEGKKEKKKRSIFDKMWEDDKKSKFLTHLLWNFTPVSRAEFLWDWEDRFKKKTCCICNVTLISRMDAAAKAPEMAKRMVEGLAKLAKEGKQANAADDVRAVFKERVFIALASPSSDVLFCPGCYQEFIQWIQMRLLMMDDKLNRILRKVRKKQENEAATNNTT